ncbi:MAG: hypothetical protein LUH07_11975, partial [Lachnospiraceae bacterium]|nr:hypothetical protein [Lachnospiraceae bacterium]
YVFSGETNVQYLIRMVLSVEITHADARIDMIFPPGGFLTRELLRRYLNEKRPIEINHIICFDASGSEDDINLNNLECFCQVLPVCLLSKKQYHLYYYYDSNIASRQTNPFPYFMVTHSCVICLSEDGTRAMLLRASEQITYYQSYFQNLVEQCHRLIQYTSDPFEIINLYQKCTDPDGFYMLMDQPCFARFYTDEFVASHIRKSPGFEQIFNVAMERFSLLRRVNHFYTIFSEAGLKRFMATGTLDDYPEELVTPFTYEERIGLVLNQAAAIRSENITSRIIQGGVFPGYLALCTTEANGIGLFTTEQFPLIDGLCSVWIRESNLCRAFHGWLTYLPGSSLTLTAKKTAEILENVARSASDTKGDAGQE